MRSFAALAGVFFACTSAMAEATITYPVPVPQGCLQLALREGAPTVITSKLQGLKARAKLARLSGSDPLVQECRAAVDRLKRSAEYVRMQASPSAAALPTPAAPAIPAAAVDVRDRTAPQ